MLSVLTNGLSNDKMAIQSQCKNLILPHFATLFFLTFKYCRSGVPISDVQSFGIRVMVK
jgi:hypothetical protein